MVSTADREGVAAQMASHPARDEPMAMSIQQFIDDENGYEDWVRDHPGGYVVNTHRTPTYG